MSLFAFDACVNFCLLSHSTVFFLFCCLKIDDIFKFVLTPGALDEYNDDDEDFRDDGEED